MTSATIQPPLISSKRTKSAAVIFLHTRMRLIQYVFIAICALLLFGTVLYFGLKDNKVQQKHKNKDDLQILPNSKEPLIKEEEKLPLVESEKGKLPPKEGIVEITKGMEESETKPSSAEGIKYTEKEDAIITSAGSILLKSALKNMVCVMGEVSPYSVACCGALSLSEDSSDDEQACLLLDSYEPSAADEFMYRLRFTMGKHLIIYKEVSGFPKPDSNCYPLEVKNGKEICASINFVLADDNLSDVTGYNSCTFMHFGYGLEQKEAENDKNTTKETDTKKDDNTNKNTITTKEADPLLGYATDVNCDIDKETIIKRSLSSPFSVVVRLKIESQNPDDIKTDEKEGSKSSKTAVSDGDKWLLSEHHDEGDSQSENDSGAKDSNDNLESAHNPSPTDSPKSESSEEEDNINSSSNEDDEPVHDTGITSVFSRILDFIRNHILGIFLTHQTENIQN